MKASLSRIFFLLLTCSFFIAKPSIAQTIEKPRKKVAVFAPLYLDSAFNSEGKYRFAANSFPKFLNPGIEFYEGVKLAIDSLKNDNARIELYVFDTKAKNKSLTGILSKPLFDSVSLIITHCSAAEAKIFAEAAIRKNTTIINANLPSDAGAIGNPFWVVLNPTLRTQCEGLYKMVQKHYSLDPIIVFRRNGTLEDRIKNYLEEYGKNTAAVKLNLQYVDVTDSTTIDEIKTYLDTTVTTTCIAGSLDETFGKNLTNKLVVLYGQGYKSSIIGMPTWDALPLGKTDYKGPEILYSNPFYNAKTDRISKSLYSDFNKLVKARPSDMVYRGFETTLHFTKLLLEYGDDFSSNISSKKYRVFTDFDIQPVLNKQSMNLDYFENKKLSFLVWQDGVIKAIY